MSGEGLSNAKSYLAELHALGAYDTCMKTIAAARILAALVADIEAAPVVKVRKVGATFGHGDEGYRWEIGNSYRPPPYDMDGVSVRLLAEDTKPAG